MSSPVTVVGLGGSMRTGSTSLTALRTALDGAASEGADTRLLWLKELNLPMCTPEHGIPDGARRLTETIAEAHAMIWTSPTYQSSISSALKNALDWLILLAEHEPTYLTNKPIGLVATAGGCRDCSPSTPWSSACARCAVGRCRWSCLSHSAGRCSTRRGGWE